MKKPVWRILQTNKATGKSMYVWATYATKARAEQICKAFREIDDSVIYEVRKEAKK